jgi:hypothetical protein
MADAEGRRHQREPVNIEPRWPVALAISFYIALSIGLRVVVPRRESFAPHWLVPGIEIAMLIALFLADPGHLGARAPWLRPLAITLIISLVITTLVTNAILIDQLIVGATITQSADSLLTSGALVYFGNALVFGLLYWQLDSGGPLARYYGDHDYPDFAFTQQINPDLAPEDWRPRYADYAILGVTTSTAFSPTDVMPMAPWAKLTMALQSLVSLTVIGLVIARAVNVFS